MSTSDAFSCSTRASRSTNNSEGDVRLWGTRNKYSTRWHQHTFVLLAQRLVLPDQLIALRLHNLHFIMVLGEDAIKLGLEHGRVLPDFSELFLQSFRLKHCITIPLEHVRLLSGSLHDILHKATTLTWVLVLLELNYSRVPIHTFIHCSARRIDSKLRATAAGLIRSSARSSSPSRVVVVASNICAERIQVHLRQGIATHLFGHPGGYFLLRLSCCYGGHLGYRHNAFNRHSLRDGATLDFRPSQHKTYGISSQEALTTTRGRPHYCSILTFYYAGFCSIASAIGATVSA
jgi:hypothetical protein